MHTYKKGLLCVMVLSAMSLMAAEDRTIYVTTFVDENGENANACSLREAIITTKKMQLMVAVPRVIRCLVKKTIFNLKLVHIN